MTRFDDGKDNGALRTIGEVSAATGIKPHVLRYWENQFPALQPLKRAGGRRLYRPDDVAMIERIDRMVSREGYTLKGVRAALSAMRGGDAAVAGASDGHSAPARGGATVSGDLLARLKAVRSKLADTLAD